MPKEDTQLKIGNAGGPGRPKGGRRVTIDKLDEMLAKAENVEKFEVALQEGFDKNPLILWKTYVFPLLPQKVALADPPGEDEFTGFDQSRRETANRPGKFLAGVRLSGSTNCNGKYTEAESRPKK